MAGAEGSAAVESSASCAELTGSQKSSHKRQQAEHGTASHCPSPQWQEGRHRGLSGAAVHRHGCAVPSAGDATLRAAPTPPRNTSTVTGDPHWLWPTSAHLETGEGFTRPCHTRHRCLERETLDVFGRCKAAKCLQAPPSSPGLAGWCKTNVGIPPLLPECAFPRGQEDKAQWLMVCYSQKAPTAPENQVSSSKAGGAERFWSLFSPAVAIVRDSLTRV